MIEDLEKKSEALHWIRASLLQIERFVASFLEFAESTEREATALAADAHFLLNPCAQAEKALSRAHRPISSDRQLTIRSLRDVHEHWEQHKKAFESKHNAKTRAALRFTEAHPDHLPWTFKIDATGTYISVLRLEDLWDELIALERECVEELVGLTAQSPVELRLTYRSRNEFPRRPSSVLGRDCQNVCVNGVI